MLAATFCLRLACGLAAALLVLSPAQVSHRFYRLQFLTILGLTCLAAVFLRDSPAFVLIALAVSLVLAFLGSLAWTLEGAPAGRILIGLTVVALLGGLIAVVSALSTRHSALFLLADDVTSAALLGSALSAMLMGHSYLIAPAMSLTPLLRLLGMLFVSIGVRTAVAGAGLWSFTAGHSLGSLEGDEALWLPVRWGIGLAAPLVLGWMAWKAAKIRSTQSATGILYVVVIFCFLGELTSQLLLQTPGIEGLQ